MGRIGGLLVAAVVGLGSAEAHAGRLDSVRSEVSGSSSSGSSSSSSGGSGSSSGSSDWDDGCCVGSTAGSTTTVSAGDAPPRPAAPPMRFRHYPYEGGGAGYMFALRPGDDAARKRAAQVWAEGAWQGRGLWRSAGGLRLDGRIFGVDGDLSYYLEPAAHDALYLGTANLSVIPIHAERGLLRLGGGINTMIDGRLPGEGPREYALGWNITTSMDLFPAWPVVVSGRVDLGRLYQAWMGRARASVGVMLWRMEIYGGYEHTQVGRVGMGGPTLGIRVWI
ncbi:MAG: hypothetical protein KDK70_04550 [Myxococcales bacterium]|nr:hypothetical protein [Myxococcales bacterium]